ncbi:molybdopterin converting factor subunit 1 [soil metagenome]
MKVQLRFFASVRETLGSAQESVDFPESVRTVGEVRQFLIERGGMWADALADTRPLRMACNQVMCDAHAPIAPDCELAFFPPVTGG